MSNGIHPKDGKQLALVPTPKMTLDRAKQVLRRHATGQVQERDLLDLAVAKLVDSWKSKVRSGKGARAKGHRYEIDVAHGLSLIYPDARRGLQSRGGTEVPDVDGTPLWVECKRKRVVSGVLQTFYRAASESDGRPPVVVVREDGQAEVALVPLELLVGLLSRTSVETAGLFYHPVRDLAGIGAVLLKNGRASESKAVES